MGCITAISDKLSTNETAKKAALAKLANNPKHIEQCPLFLIWVADTSRNQRLGALIQSTGAGVAALRYEAVSQTRVHDAGEITLF